jgi:hypothetical protein
MPTLEADLRSRIRTRFVALSAAMAMIAGTFSLVATARTLQKKSASEKSFLWQANLRDAGFAPIELQLQSPDQQISNTLVRLSASSRMGYLDNRTIFFSYVRKNEIQGLQHRYDPDHARPYTLYAIFIDAGSGKVVRKQSFPSDVPDAFVAPRDDGNYIVYDAEHISSFDHDGAPLKQMGLLGPKKNYLDLWGASVSESGHTVFVQLHSATSTDCEWIDTMMMSENVDACDLPASVAITDDELAFSGNDKKNPRVALVSDSKLGAEWHQVCSSQKLPSCRSAQFLLGRLVVYSSSGFAFIDAANGAPYQYKFPGDTVPQAFTSARTKQRFSVLLFPSLTVTMNPAEGESGFFQVPVPDGTAHLYFFDLPLEKPTFEIELRYDAKSHLNAVISPNGLQAVVFRADSLRAYSIPD